MSAIFTQAASLWSQMKADYDDAIEAQIRRAEAETNGAMVSHAGRERGVGAESLFTGSEARAKKYASDELLAFWAVHPRLRLDEFEEQWAGMMFA